MAFALSSKLCTANRQPAACAGVPNDAAASRVHDQGAGVGALGAAGSPLTYRYFQALRGGIEVRQGCGFRAEPTIQNKLEVS
jgi:hypothetical protein